MAYQANLNLWIIEDSVKEVEKYYLQPLQAFSNTRRGNESSLPFPNVNVVFLRLNEGQKEMANDLRKRAHSNYTLNTTIFLPDEGMENDPQAFLAHYKRLIQDQDIVLVDPTISGMQWEMPTDVDTFLCYVANQTMLWKSSTYKDRVLLVSNDTRFSENHPDDAHWEDFYKRAIPKLTLNVMAELYRRRLAPFLTYRVDWTRSLSPAGVETLVPFVEELRCDRNAQAIFNNIGECAYRSLMQLLFPKPKGPMDLIEATDGNYYIDPAADNLNSCEPLPTSKPHLYTILIRRYVLYGLRRLWMDYTKRLDEREYKLWLEVVAAGYHWYADEYEAIRTLREHLKQGQVSLTTDNRIDLESAGLEFEGKNKLVRYANIQNRAGVRGAEYCPMGIRFIHGDIYFKYRGEWAGDRPKYRYEIRYTGSAEVPPHKAPGRAWDRFWQQARIEDFKITRVGQVEKFQNQICSRCYFKDSGEMLSFRAPMDEESSWWTSQGEAIKQYIDSLLSQMASDDVFNPFDVTQQSKRKAKFAQMRKRYRSDHFQLGDVDYQEQTDDDWS